MTLQEFIEKFDKENTIVLLEGKRKVSEQDQQKLIKLGHILALQTKHIIFRSGNAEGADQLFSEGVVSVDKKRLQVITPYSTHRKNKNVADETISLNELNLATEPEVVYQSKRNKKTSHLVDQFAAGKINRITIKAAYIIRDTVKVIGTQSIQRADFAVFYDDLSKPMTGGTGHTMDICQQNNVPFVDQHTWFNWLNE